MSDLTRIMETFAEVGLSHELITREKASEYERETGTTDELGVHVRVSGGPQDVTDLVGYVLLTVNTDVKLFFYRNENYLDLGNSADSAFYRRDEEPEYSYYEERAPQQR